MQLGGRSAVEAIGRKHDLPAKSPPFAPGHDDEPSITEAIIGVAVGGVGVALEEIQDIGTVAATSPLWRGKVEVEVNGSHEILHQVKDEPTNQSRESPIVDIATKDAERELCVTADSDHDEADATKNGAHGGQVGKVKRISIRRALAQGAAVADIGLSQVACSGSGHGARRTPRRLMTPSHETAMVP